MARQIESTAYHEVGHITAAVVQAMPLRETGVHIDLHGHGRADYFEKGLRDLGTTALDDKERKYTIIALYSAHMAQLRFYPECEHIGWLDDLLKIEALSNQVFPNDESARLNLKEEMRERAKKLVDAHWELIDELARLLLAQPCTPMSPEDEWGCGKEKHNMSGHEIAEFFARHKICTKVMGDDVRDYDSRQDVPHYDSLAL